MSQKLELANGETITFETVDSSQGKVMVVADFDIQTHVGTVDEIIARDSYKVQHLRYKGYNPSTIIDIGAQNGVFTRLCSNLWPDARIHCFEPVLPTFRCLALNATPNCTLYNLPVLGCSIPRSVGNPEEEKWFRDGHYFPALRLPRAQVLKIDCEGGERNILKDLAGADRLKDFDVIVGEWHFDEAREIVKTLVGLTHNVEIVEEGNWNLFSAFRKGFVPAG